MTPMDLDRAIDRIYLFHYVPAGVVVDEEMEILQFRGNTGLFLEHQPGAASLNLFRLARPEIAAVLNQAITFARNTGQPAAASGMTARHHETDSRFVIEVFPLPAIDNKRNFLVVFRQTTPDETGTKDTQPLSTADAATDPLLVPSHSAPAFDLGRFMKERAQSEPTPDPAPPPATMPTGDTPEEPPQTPDTVQPASESDYAEVLFSTVREAIVVIDRQLLIRRANKTFYQLFGLNEAESGDQPLPDLLASAGFNIPRNMLENMFRHRTLKNAEFWQTMRDTEQKVVSISGQKVDSPDGSVLLLAIEDITARKKAEQVMADREVWLRNMTDNIPVMICITGPDNTGHFFNSAWIRYTGRTREQEENSGWTAGIHPADTGRYHEMFNNHFAKREPFQLEFRLQRYDGKYRWVNNSWQPVFTHEGSFTGYIVSCTEIHDKKIIQEELKKEIGDRTADLQRMNAELEQFNHELQQFTYVSSHDLQEPLRKIITYADRLQEKLKDKGPETGKDFLGKIIGSARYMSYLINDLLEYSRLSRTEEQFVKCDLQAVLNKVQKQFERMIRDKKATIRCDKLPVIDAAPQQMEQLFTHALSNALKFVHKERTPVITISVKKLSGEKLQQYLKDSQPALYYEIIVRDNGIGFNQQYADQVFTIFQRLHAKQDFPGTGIGLALCRKIVYNHKGDIYAESVENEGTALHIILPARVFQHSVTE